MSEENNQTEQEAGTKKNKKISKMTMQELDSEISKSSEVMNGQGAQYVQHLLARKEELSAK